MERGNHEGQRNHLPRRHATRMEETWKRFCNVYAIFSIFIWRNRLKEINNKNKGRKVRYGGNKQIYLAG